MAVNILGLKSKIKGNLALLYSLSNKGWAILVSIVNIILITSFFSKEQQGFFYTFNNLLIFQTLLDLGFGVVLIQFISHEWAFLYLKQDLIDGDSNAKGRLAALIRLSIKWYLLVGILFFLLIGILGYFFLSLRNEGAVNFEIPWFSLCASVTLAIIIVPFKYFLDGSNQVAQSQKIALFSSIASAIATWIAIYKGAGLYTPFITSFVNVVVSIFFLTKRSLPFLKLSKLRIVDEKLFWKSEFFSQQWRIGISWLSGYVMFQSFVPISFLMLDPTTAGKVGGTLQLFNGVYQIGLISVNIILPQIGILSAKKEFGVLRSLLKKTLTKCLLLAAIAFIAVVLILVVCINLHFKQVNRITDLTTTCFFLMPAILLQFSNVETYAIRFQKKEPFLTNSIVSSFIMVISNVFSAKYFGVRGMAVCFTIVSSIILIPWIHVIYKREFKKLLLT